jgi:hypothetical protein
MMGKGRSGGWMGVHTSTVPEPQVAFQRPPEKLIQFLWPQGPSPMSILGLIVTDMRKSSCRVGVGRLMEAANESSGKSRLISSLCMVARVIYRGSAPRLLGEDGRGRSLKSAEALPPLSVLALILLQSWLVRLRWSLVI